MVDVAKLLIAVCVILTATYIGRSRVELAGLIAVMPLTGLVVMLWIWHDSGGDAYKMSRYTIGAVLGIIPAILFFLVSFICFRKQMHLGWILALGFSAWLAAAFVHQFFLSKH